MAIHILYAVAMNSAGSCQTAFVQKHIQAGLFSNPRVDIFLEQFRVNGPGKVPLEGLTIPTKIASISSTLQEEGMQRKHFIS